jgi:hypothetical protein
MAILLGAAIALTGCGGKEQPAAADATAQAPAPSAEAVAADAEAASQTLAATDATWTPEALEELLAPVALYPDVVLGQVLVASTNPQEVLDAGNWLLQNQSLKGDALDEAAKKVGFTPPIRGLLQFTEVVDVMCSEMGWTEELGQAYVNDQAGVLEAVQRLRAQAKDAGNLASSEQMKVATEVQEGQEVITVSPPSPQVVYVPQYDPVAAYAPAPVSAAPAATSTTTTTTEAKGHSTGTVVATGLLSFGAGLLVANIFDDDDDDYYHNGYYNPYYGGRPPPYYPPYPYRPSYGNGYYPSNGYNRPPNYRPGGNNNTVIINQNNNYWNNYGDKPGANRNSRSAKSPITTAKPNRRELDSLNAKAKQGPKRPAPGKLDSSKVQGTYAGAKRPDATRAASPSGGRAQPKVQGSYAGAKPKAPGATTKLASAKPTARPSAANLNRPAAKPATGAKQAATADRGRPTPQASKPASRPAAMPSAKPANRPAAATSRAPERANKSAVSGASRGGADRAASQRGKQSMPKGVPAKAKGGGGGNKKRK